MNNAVEYSRPQGPSSQVDCAPSDRELSASDPVAIVIENYVRELKGKNGRAFQAYRQDSRIHLTLGQLTADGENYDIALVRLGCALLDDGEISGPLKAALHQHLALMD